jgi:hypothetical protein
MHKVVITLIFCSLFSLTLFAADATNKTVTITAPAKFTKGNDWYVLLTIDDTKHKYDVPWFSPGYDDGLVKLETNRVYTFTIAEELVKIHEKTYTTYQVVKVQQDGKTIYDHEICEVHHAKMQFQEVPIHYGLPAPDPNDQKGEKARRLFPHGRAYVLGGCVIDDISPKTGKTYVCKQCQDAFAKWKKQHPTKTK